MHHTIEIEVEYNDMYFSADVTYEAHLVDKSFSYSYGSINSVHHEIGWDNIKITWKKEEYTPEVNMLIGIEAENELDNVLNIMYEKYTSY